VRVQEWAADRGWGQYPPQRRRMGAVERRPNRKPDVMDRILLVMFAAVVGPLGLGIAAVGCIIGYAIFFGGH
jgi:hypothetical protein